jgi:membrane protease subunit (stomatin/prohibitin family)
MRMEEIFHLAETHGWIDDFGRWNFKNDDALLEFVDAIVRTHTPEDIKNIERKWVSLTDTEMCECYNSKSIGYAIEAKLKEKNTWNP